MDASQPKNYGDAVDVVHCASNSDASNAKSKSNATSNDMTELFDERVAIMLESQVEYAKAIRTAYAQVRQAYRDNEMPEEIIVKVSECL